MTNDERRDEMPYKKAPQTEFQRFIRLRKDGEFFYFLEKLYKKNNGFFVVLLFIRFLFHFVMPNKALICPHVGFHL